MKKYGRLDTLARYFKEEYEKITVGRYMYGYAQITNKNVCRIGAFTSIGAHLVIVSNDHRIDWVTTSPIASLKEFCFVDKDYMENYIAKDDRKTIIGNDVWIRAGCIIFEGRSYRVEHALMREETVGIAPRAKVIKMFSDKIPA